MIRSIRLAEVATYAAAGVQMGPLSTCNFVYGPNGSGKTTLARYLFATGAPSFSSCSVAWENNRALRTVVYNRDFVDQVFNEKGRVKGVFTLGKEGVDFKDRMDELSEKLKEEVAKHRRLTVTLEGEDGKGGKSAELEAASKELKDACLKQTRKHEKEFEQALVGLRGNSAVFMTKFLAERGDNKGTLHEYEVLRERARSVFASNPTRVEPLSAPDVSGLKTLEEDDIFAKPIVGKGDVNIAALVARLRNSDWVAEGAVFLQQSRPQCPFCQQEVPDSLERELTDFFDESFTAAKAHLGKVVNDYGEQTVVVRTALNALMAAPVPYHDPVELGQLLDVFDARLSAAKLQMTRKVEGPSAIFEIEGVSSSLEEIRKFVTAANERIAEHNRRVANAGAEKTRLIADFWRYLIDVELKDAAAAYDRINGTVGKAVQALGAQMRQSMADHARLKQELEELEQKTTGTQPTVDKINSTLRWFNFTNFHLAPADEAHTYQLIRQDGAPAHISLSEGERTFVTFLYFYHLAQAGDSSTGVEDDWVVVLDDPISSLDSDILFIVSTLVREIADMARDGTGPIKQVLVLTHVYFHKEITFARNGGALPKTAYWTCRKKSGWTEMVGPMDTNPVKSSYQLLWHDVRKPEGHSETLPNTMRRIFDSYFKLLGGVDVHKKSAEFEGDDRLACNALLSWANDASHAVHDDVHMAPGDIPTEVYLDVFRRVFGNLGHEGHYRMMMGDDFKEGVLETEAA